MEELILNILKFAPEGYVLVEIIRKIHVRPNKNVKLHSYHNILFLERIKSKIID